MSAEFKNLTYEIVSSEEGETTASVTVRFTNIDSRQFVHRALRAGQAAVGHDGEYEVNR